MTPTVPFVKATACGNDFLLIESEFAPAEIGAFTRQICDRHFGVGADGVEWLYSDPEADIRARLLNSDGSEAEISGNGTRCVAAYLAFRQAKQSVVIATDAGVKTCTLIARSDTRFEFETWIGEPQVGEEMSITLASGRVSGVPVIVGNPHFVIFVNEFTHGWQTQASEIGRHSAFPDGVNVELVAVRDPSHIEMRIFERGAGETCSSGTGSCASAVAAIATGRAKSPVRVQAAGGVQTVRWDGEIHLRGPAQILCEGEFFL